MIDIIFNEDCFETFKRLEDKSVDMILCDLPYGTTACKWDTRIPLEPLWKEYKRITKKNGAIVLTASQPFTSILVMSNLEGFRHQWIWDKKQAGNPFLAKAAPLKTFEDVLVFSSGKVNYYPQMRTGKFRQKGGSRVTNRITGTEANGYEQYNDRYYPSAIIEFSTAGERGKSTHPTQKPVALFEYLIKTYTNKGELVLDNCMGSGTTAIACLNTNRHYIGCELDKGYYDIAVKRIEESKQKPKLC